MLVTSYSSRSSSPTDAVVPEDATLNDDDAMQIVCEIHEVQTKSATLGRLLKVKKTTVDSIHQQYSDPQERLVRVIDEFLKQVEPRPTWRIIANALRSSLINLPALAKKIEEKYCLLLPQQKGSFYIPLTTYYAYHCLISFHWLTIPTHGMLFH